MIDEENDPIEHEIVPDQSVWRFALVMAILVLIMALLTIFLEDIRQLFNPPPAPAVSQVSPAVAPDEQLSDEELKGSLTRFIEAFYVDQKKGYFDPPSYFSPITDTYYKYHHLTYKQLRKIHFERLADVRNLELNWLVHTLTIERRTDTLVATYWTKQTYFRPSTSAQEKADVLIELKITKEGKICSLKELDVLNQVSTPTYSTTTSEPSSTTQSQESAPEAPQPKPPVAPSVYALSSLDSPPEFNGGSKKLNRFLGRNLRYPTLAQENGVQGRVFISFVVEANGGLSTFKVVRGIGSGCDEEALRVMRLSPPWNPGILHGEPVRSTYILPITFQLSN